MVEPEPFPTVEGHETIARHCRNKNHMRTQLKKSDWTAFMPPPSRRLSVYRSSGIDAEQLALIGRTYVVASVKGHAEIASEVVRSRGLAVEAAPHPHPRHANILGWSEADEVNRLTAKALADASVLTVY